MSLRKISLLIIFSLSLITVNSAFASNEQASVAIHTMADIMISLHHFPSDTDKKKLTELTAGLAATADEKTIAKALMNVKHKVADADRPKLMAITIDSSASPAVKSLASILLNLDHQISEADTAALKKISN